MVRRFAVSLLAAALLVPAGLAAQEAATTSTPPEGGTNGLEQLEKRIEELEKTNAAYSDSLQRVRELEARLEELEKAKQVQEDATRAIIDQAISSSGSRINNYVTLGGNFEAVGGWGKDLNGVKENVLTLNSAQLDFEIQVNDWTLGSFIFEYDDGSNTLFATTQEREVSVDRINIDTAWIGLGNPEKVIPYAKVGRLIVPFGISTGDPIADVLTLEDPLTLEAFEMRQDAFMIGFAFPTPAPVPLTLRTPPPPVRPRFLNPTLSLISRAFGYRPPPKLVQPVTQTVTALPPPPPPFNLGAFFFRGQVADQLPLHAWKPGDNYGFTAGFRTSGPWSVNVDVDWNSSVFDSRFLSDGYYEFLDQIGLVPGMAASLKAKLGPVPLVVEWNGALKNAKGIDDLEVPFSIRPSAWEVSLGYQFDWNSSVEALGAQGSYLAVGYSESRDLGGVSAVFANLETRVGSVPEKRFLIDYGEWVWEGFRIALEYSRFKDYDRGKGGTGKVGNAALMSLTYEW
jgi:hypothetical protein